MKENTAYDVIIIGGSYAGLSAAMALGRSNRSTLIIDSGLPCNRQTPFSHNFITQDGVKPDEIARKAKEQVLAYETVNFSADSAIEVTKTTSGFRVSTAKKQLFETKKIILATGIKDILPDIKGLSECWGISVIHCPYCHGYEFKTKKTGIMANADRAFHLATLVHNLTDQITLFTADSTAFHAEQIATLQRNNIPVVHDKIVEIKHENGHLKNIVFSNGNSFPLDALYAAVPFEQQTTIWSALSLEMTEQGYIKVDDFQKTTVPGVYACGDNSSAMRSVANAVYTGNKAGAMVNSELCAEEF